jgi:hypothetical protein
MLDRQSELLVRNLSIVVSSRCDNKMTGIVSIYLIVSLHHKTICLEEKGSLNNLLSSPASHALRSNQNRIHASASSPALLEIKLTATTSFTEGPTFKSAV